MASGSSNITIVLLEHDQNEVAFIEHVLKKASYRLIVVTGAKDNLDSLEKNWPNLLLVSEMMLDDLAWLIHLKQRENLDLSTVPTIVLSMHPEQFKDITLPDIHIVEALGQPLNEQMLTDAVAHHLQSDADAGNRGHLRRSAKETENAFSFNDFYVEQIAYFQRLKQDLATRLADREADEGKLLAIRANDMYALAPIANLPPRQLAKYVATFLKLPFTPLVNPDDVLKDVLTPQFCKRHAVVVTKDEDDHRIFNLTNPFDFELIDVLKNMTAPEPPTLVITEPSIIDTLFSDNLAAKPDPDAGDTMRIVSRSEVSLLDTEQALGQSSLTSLADSLLADAVRERASDVHIEPKGVTTVVRLRVDGDLRDMINLTKRSGSMVISRLKALAGLDIAEQRRPQDGAVEAIIDNRQFLFRLATTSTPYGESLVIRVLEPNAKVKQLVELGMREEIAGKLTALARRNNGLILVVGPTGSGKISTLFSLLSLVDCRTRSLISVEDPVEYRLPFANQQEVNDKAGVTFQALLKSAVRQDPDILLIGEIRDDYSARIALDSASTGHLCLTTLHTNNATTAIFRLERLGIGRSQMADSVLCIIAQRLIKMLCPHCKQILPITPEEREMLSGFTTETPDYVAHPVGCARCMHTGYLGREGVYEMLEITRPVAELIRNGASIPDIRRRIKKSGTTLLSNAAVEKVKRLICTPYDIYDYFLAEEVLAGRLDEEEAAEATREAEEATKAAAPARPKPAEKARPEPARESEPAVEAAPVEAASEPTSETVITLDDPLTGLPNRHKFHAIAEHQLRVARRIKSPLAIIYVNVDNAPALRESQGPEVAQRALQDTAKILENTFRDSDVVARLQEDRFVVLAWGTNEDGGAACLKRVKDRITKLNNGKNRAYKVSITAGIAYFDPGDPQPIDELMSGAEADLTEPEPAPV